MHQKHYTLSIPCHGRGLHDITQAVDDRVQSSSIMAGLLNLFVQHTSCSLLIQENADPEVQRDLDRFFSRLIPDGDPLFRHRQEGPDDMPAHVRAALTQTSLTIPVEDGRMALGIWQGVYLYEHRLQAMRRKVQIHLLGE